MVQCIRKGYLVLNMKLLNIIEEDFINYKVPTMSLLFPFCSMKCNLEAGREVCHNTNVDTSKLLDISNEVIIKKYLANDISQAIVFYGMEPMDSWEELISFIEDFRKVCDADCIIYTGFYPDEIKEQIKELKKYKNIIIKYGRFIPNQKSIEDKILGITLASDNQWAEKIS